MLIANPLYDVVFKFLMEDARLARLLIGQIIGEKITAITPRPQEFTIPKDAPGRHTVYRMDFSACIKTPTGSKTIIVEVQKAKFPADIIRFRRYLGQQYANPRNIEARDDADRLTNSKRGLPIISIYFLGYPLPGIDAPVLKIERTYLDVTTKKTFDIRDEFIEGITHDSFVIQATRLKKRRRNDLEAMLAVFDQSNRTKDHHILNVSEQDFPERFRNLIRRLQAAAETETVRESMFVEDEIFEEFAEAERRAAENLAAKDQVIEEKDKALKEKDKVMEVKDKALAEQAKALSESEDLISRLRREIERLKPPSLQELPAAYNSSTSSSSAPLARPKPRPGKRTKKTA